MPQTLNKARPPQHVLRDIFDPLYLHTKHLHTQIQGKIQGFHLKQFIPGKRARYGKKDVQHVKAHQSSCVDLPTWGQMAKVCGS